MSLLHSTPARILVVAILAVIALLPVAIFPVLGLGDTLNHLARMHILLAIARSPDLQSHYQVHWAPIPYLAMDMIVPVLAIIFPLYVAGRIFVGVCVLMPAFTASVLHRVLYGRWSMIPAAGLLIGWNIVLSLGFLNFAFAAGCAVLLFAAWIRVAARERWLRAALFCAPATLLYLGHAFAFLGYCVAVAGYEFARAARRSPKSLKHTALDWLAAASQAAPALYLAATLDLHQAYVGALSTRYGSIGERISALASPFAFQFSASDGLIVACGCAVLVLLSRHLKLHQFAWPAGVLLLIASFGVPTVLWSTWGTDLRLPLIAAIIVLAGLAWKEPPGSMAAIVLPVLLTALLCIRVADVISVLRPAEARIDDARRVLAALPRGARLLQVDATGPRTQSDVPLSTKWQMAMLAVIDRDAFVPTLFTGMTTVRVRPDRVFSSTPNGLPISLLQLRQCERANDGGVEHSDYNNVGARIYWLGWPTKFDYVFVQHGPAPYEVPAILTRVASSRTADLYRIDVKRP